MKERSKQKRVKIKAIELYKKRSKKTKTDKRRQKKTKEDKGIQKNTKLKEYKQY